nr:MAG TPA: hypothetical protein [Caudoviricetes sp.]
MIFITTVLLGLIKSRILKYYLVFFHISPPKP